VRIAVFSDVHGNLDALEAVLEDIEAQHVDAVLGLGDFVSGPFDPAGVADRLMALSAPCVRGNHDRTTANDPDWDIDLFARERLSDSQVAWLGALPLNHVHAGEVLLCHGTPRSDETNWMDGVLPPDGRIVHMSRDFIEEQAAGFAYPVLLCGHTHVPRTLRLGDGRLVVNPGSVGWGFAFGSPDAKYSIIEKRAAGWRVDLKAIPYDTAAAGRAATAAGFPNWAEAVHFGWSNPYQL
jgi:putative phosphoesterase